MTRADHILEKIAKKKEQRVDPLAGRVGNVVGGVYGGQLGAGLGALGGLGALEAKEAIETKFAKKPSYLQKLKGVITRGGTPLASAATSTLSAINKPMPWMAAGGIAGLGAGAYLGGKFGGRILGGPKVETNEGMLQKQAGLGTMFKAIPKIIGKPWASKIPPSAIGNAAIGTTIAGGAAAAAKKGDTTKKKGQTIYSHLLTKTKPWESKHASYTKADVIMEKEAAWGTALKGIATVGKKLIPKSKLGKGYLAYDIASPGRAFATGAGRLLGKGKNFKAPKGNTFDEWVLGGFPATKVIGDALGF